MGRDTLPIHSVNRASNRTLATIIKTFHSRKGNGAEGGYSASNSADEFSVAFIDTVDTSRDFDFCTCMKSSSSTLFNNLIDSNPSFCRFILENFNCRAYDEVFLFLIRGDVH